MSTETETTLRLTRTIAADPEVVFRAWTDPEQMKRWSAPEGYTVAEVRSELKVGGRFLIRMESPEGPVHTAVGTYREVDPPRRVVYTWDWEEEEGSMGDTLVTVEFRDAGEGRTEIELTHELFPTPDAAREHETGWTSCLNRLEAIFAEGNRAD